MRVRPLLVIFVVAVLAFVPGPSPSPGGPAATGRTCVDAPTTCEEAWARLHPLRAEHQPFLRPLRDPFPPPGEDVGCEECCSTWDDDRHVFEEARPGWVRYTNVRFGFSVEVPADWYRSCPPMNGDGQSFHSPDGLVRLSLWGSFLICDGSNAVGLQTLEEYARYYGPRQCTKVVVDGWEGIEWVGPWPDPDDPGREGATAVAPPCFVERLIVLLGLTEVRGIALTAAVPLYPESTELLDGILQSYRAGDLDGWASG